MTTATQPIIDIPNDSATPQGKRKRSVKIANPSTIVRDYFQDYIAKNPEATEELEQKYDETFVNPDANVFGYDFTKEDLPLLGYILTHKNRHNRAVSKKGVSDHIDNINGGRWFWQLSQIMFQQDGALQNGQHRLYAFFICLSGLVKEIKTMVISQLPVEANMYTDQLKRRTTAQHMEMLFTDVEDIKKISSIVTGALKMRELGKASPMKINSEVVYATIEKHISFLQDMMSYFSQCPKCVRSWGFWAPAFLAAMSNRKKAAKLFMNELSKEFPDAQPAIELHKIAEHLRVHHATGNRPNDQYTRSVLCYNALQEGRDIDKNDYVKPVGRNSKTGKLPRPEEVKINL